MRTLDRTTLDLMQNGSLSVTDAHRTILNDDPTLRGFAAHVDTMHPDLWLDEAVLQIISLTTNGVGGPNEAETAIAIRKANGQTIGTKGVRPTLVLAGDVNLDGKVTRTEMASNSRDPAGVSQAFESRALSTGCAALHPRLQTRAPSGRFRGSCRFCLTDGRDWSKAATAREREGCTERNLGGTIPA